MFDLAEHRHPWGRRYLYQFDTAANGWNYGGFVLYSVGLDGLFTAPVNGIVDVNALGNPDNTYHGRN